MSAPEKDTKQRYLETMRGALSPKVFNPEDLDYLFVIVLDLFKENATLKRRLQEIVDHYQLY